MSYISLLHKTAPLALAVALASASCAQAQSTTDEEEKVDAAVEENAVEMEEILVRGVRQSLMLAQDLKMNSDSIIDAIVAEDIGKLPDITAAESIARIAGVQVTRYNDEANAILIRGLPDVTTTYNGREFFTAELRRGQLQDFPSQALAGIEVYKSGTAELIEPGLAGLVNVRTRRPFDFAEEKIAGGVHYGHNDQSEKSAPAGNILYSNRWDTDLGEFGFLANATYAKSEYYNGARYNATWFPSAEPWWNIEAPYSDGGFVLPATVGMYNSSGERSRPSANIALQWRPNDQLEVYFDGIFQGYRGTGAADNFWFSMTEWDWLNWNGTPTATTDVTLTNIEMVEGTDNGQVASLTKWGGLPPQMYRSTNKDRTDTYQYAIGAKWDLDSVHIETDLAYTDSEYNNSSWSFDSGLSFSPTVNANFFGDQGVTFDSPDWDVTDESTYIARGYYESLYEVGGKGLQWRTDFTFDTGWGDWLHTVQTGFRYSDREATRQSGDRYAWFWNLGIPVTEIAALDMELTQDPFRTNEQGLTQYLAPTISSIQSNHDALAAYAYQAALDSWDSWRAPAWETADIAIDPANDWRADEQSYAVYLQTKSHFDLASVGVDIFAGVRVVQTISENHGTSSVIYDGVKTLEPRVKENEYVDVLPNISIRAMLTDKLQFRAGFTQTRTKPNFGDLNPALNINQIVQVNSDVPPPPNAQELEYDADGWGGNPDLEPLTSDNYDVSLEYYFAKTGYASAAVFYRDLWGFTNWYTRFVEDPEYGTVRLNTPENAGEGKLEGWELNLSTFMDFEFIPEFLHPFGISANVTYLKGENRLPDADGEFGEFVEIPGLSKYTYNAAIFYEKEKFSTRLSYNAREAWVNWYGDTSDGSFAGNKTHTRDRLDFSASYDVTDNISVYADVANILAKPFRNYTVIEGYSYPQDVRDEGRYFGTGFRFSF